MNARDWSKCFLCQLEKDELLRHPAKDKRQCSNLQQVYTDTVNNVLELNELDALPSDIVLIDYGRGIKELVEGMLKNVVCWHKNCKSNVDNQKVNKARNAKKRLADPVAPNTERLRSSNGVDPAPAVSEEKHQVPCFLCDKTGGKRYKASTFAIDFTVQHCAAIIGDEKLISKLSAGDLMAQDVEYHLTCLCRLYRQAANEGEDQEDEADHCMRVAKGIF